jgi:hypothetical protein
VTTRAEVQECVCGWARSGVQQRSGPPSGVRNAEVAADIANRVKNQEIYSKDYSGVTVLAAIEAIEAAARESGIVLTTHRRHGSSSRGGRARGPRAGGGPSFSTKHIGNIACKPLRRVPGR